MIHLLKNQPLREQYADQAKKRLMTDKSQIQMLTELL
jgi:hypothetical protein